MKKIITKFSVVCFIAVAFVACKKEAKAPKIYDETLGQISALGFSTNGVQKIDGGYLVEGDIVLSNQDLASSPTSPNMVIAKEEQYRTFNLMSSSKHPTVQIALDLATSSPHYAAFDAALTEAIRRYNAEPLNYEMEKVAKGTTGTDITLVAYYENSSTLGSAGFPDSQGNPYPTVKMNTYHYSTGTDATNVNYIGTIMAHEFGHCVGFRHTDYMRRRYSCGYGGNEGQESTGVGAVHIPGTPTGPDAASWMLACIGKGVNRPFNSNDKIALNYLW